MDGDHELAALRAQRIAEMKSKSGGMPSGVRTNASANISLQVTIWIISDGWRTKSNRRPRTRKGTVSFYCRALLFISTCCLGKCKR